jgi:hypothetical protein
VMNEEEGEEEEEEGKEKEEENIGVTAWGIWDAWSSHRKTKNLQKYVQLIRACTEDEHLGGRKHFVLLLLLLC